MMNFALVCLYYPLKNAMKYIQKLLNPLNPILPAFLLLIAFLWFGYSNFVKEKYTEEEKIIFEEGIKFTDELSDLYKKETRLPRNYLKEYIIEEDYTSEFCLEQHYLELYVTDKKLDSLTQVLIKNNFDKIDFSTGKDISITSTFEKYISEAQNIAPLLQKRYENFDLENDLNNFQLNQLYFSRDSLESKYHLVRFKTQLLEMYHNDIQFLRKETITNKVEVILSNYAIQPFICSDGCGYPNQYSLELTLFIPFDTANTRIITPKNVETHFNKKGFLIIPPSLRNDKKEKLAVGRICGSDTTTMIKL
ncbi:hypothetical protein V9L05_12295 [Bernardetia sp. Wsw4-3y2]|uniref:hypothetical protein n=1 Tax=Bernardetia sp. Wsw4-3y2 TaxID=3127471 RepID=UPI0030CD841F